MTQWLISLRQYGNTVVVSDETDRQKLIGIARAKLHLQHISLITLISVASIRRVGSRGGGRDKMFLKD